MKTTYISTVTAALLFGAGAIMADSGVANQIDVTQEGMVATRPR
ncbi:hypothetical protein [Halorhodospira halochloris]|nr:hypothetical protein [Halorhodospira halochloris]